MFTPDTLKGKSILVTGGGSGLGLSMAKHFAAHGANVAICGRTEDKLREAAKEIEAGKQPGVKVLTHAVDVRDFDAVGVMIKRLVEEFGSLEGLVNNAAGNFLSPSEDITPNGFKSVVDIVLHGTFNCTQHFGNYLINSERQGSVLSIVTTYTETGSAFVLPSACAKAGVYAMTTTLAYEWGTYGIRLNSIAPGPFPTEGAWSRLLPTKEIQEKYLKKVALGRVGKHEELANLAVFLMSDLAGYITGECVTIDGGERLAGGEFNLFVTEFDRKPLKQMFQAMKPKK
ncbi:MAG: SDR family oxidoreductase [Candidatus Kapabacteria bacterium]|jgi:NAD(P)-dependent dehydrogenase (short-subunit alcohol dehydrogenase family)|nr:SDR family oxidoreductase [Candidatus Kapabacteria bacterium]